MDNPYLNVVNKKLRAIRKKYERIVTLESQVREGKVLNEEQVNSNLNINTLYRIATMRCMRVDC